MKINKFIIPMAVALTTAHIQGAITSSSFTFTSSTTVELQLTGDLSGVAVPLTSKDGIFISISDPTYDYVNGLAAGTFLYQSDTTETSTNALFGENSATNIVSVAEQFAFFGDYLVLKPTRNLETSDDLTGTYTLTLPSGYTFTPASPMTWTYHVNWGYSGLVDFVYNDTASQIASGTVGSLVPESSTTLIASCGMLSLLLKRRRAC